MYGFNKTETSYKCYYFHLVVCDNGELLPLHELLQCVHSSTGFYFIIMLCADLLYYRMQTLLHCTGILYKMYL